MKTLCFVLLAILIAPGLASACSCGRLGAKEALKYSDIAFRGELVAHKGDLAIFHVDEGGKAILEATSSSRGETVRTATATDSGPSCCKLEQRCCCLGRGDGRSFYSADICLPQAPASEADAYLKDLGPGNPPRKD